MNPEDTSSNSEHFHLDRNQKFALLAVFLLFAGGASLFGLALLKELTQTRLLVIHVLIVSAVMVPPFIRMIVRKRWPFEEKVRAIALALVSPVIPLAVLTAANQHLDSSASVVAFFEISNKKYVAREWKAGPFYWLYLTPTQDRFPERIAVSPKTFDQVTPGETRITLKLRPGFLGYPWLEGYVLEQPQEKGQR